MIYNEQLKTRPLNAHEIPIWSATERWLRTRQNWTHDEIRYLKYRLSNEIDGFKRFYESEIKNNLS